MSRDTGKMEPVEFCAGNKDCIRVYSAHSHMPFELVGAVFARGPQPVGVSGGAPQWVADALAANESIESITVNYRGSGVTYRRMPFVPDPGRIR